MNCVHATAGDSSWLRPPDAVACLSTHAHLRCLTPLPNWSADAAQQQGLAQLFAPGQEEIQKVWVACWACRAVLRCIMLCHAMLCCAHACHLAERYLMYPGCQLCGMLLAPTCPPATPVPQLIGEAARDTRLLHASVAYTMVAGGYGGLTVDGLRQVGVAVVSGRRVGQVVLHARATVEFLDVLHGAMPPKSSTADQPALPTCSTTPVR